MIRKLLIANRGEIAVRIIRACREMGIATVAVYSEADEESLHTQLADEAICIGPGPSAQSYLNMEQIISATMVSGADAIHPGFGFLSENARFAELCEKCGITFVGPPSKVIRMLGNKKIARSTMIAAGVPVVPGSEGDVEDIETGLKEAERIGYPVIIKAALGGGGKGMRVANTPEEFPEAYATARKESEIAFGDGTMYIEHFVVNPRHIEFQILADSFGNKRRILLKQFYVSGIIGTFRAALSGSIMTTPTEIGHFVSEELLPRIAPHMQMPSQSETAQQPAASPQAQ